MKKIVALILAAVILIVGVVLVFVFTLNNDSSGRSKDDGSNKSSVVASSENFEISNTMMEYYANSYYQNWYSENYYYILLGYINFDSNKPLDEQYTDVSQTQTYFDYFVNGTKTMVETYLKYCEAAKADPRVDFETLEAEAEQYATDSINQIKQAAAEYSRVYEETYKQSFSHSDYIKMHFGENVTEEALYKSFVIEKISASYYNIVYDRIYNSTTHLREDEYFADNLSSFVHAEYLFYTLSSQKTVEWPIAEDYFGGAESVAYKNDIEGKTAQEIKELGITPEDYHGGEYSEAYKRALEEAQENYMYNQMSEARDREIMERLASATTTDEFKRIILEVRYTELFEKVYSYETKKIDYSNKPSAGELAVYNTNELKNAIIDAVIYGEDDIDYSIIEFHENAHGTWVEAAYRIPKMLIQELKKAISDLTKNVSYTLDTAVGKVLFGGVKGQYGIAYEEYEDPNGTSASTGDVWMWNEWEANVQNYEFQKNIMMNKIRKLEEQISRATDAQVIIELNHEKQLLEDSFYSIENRWHYYEDKLDNADSTGEYSYGAYFVTQAAHREDYHYRNVGHILFKVDSSKYTDPAVSYETSEEAKAAMESLLAKMQATAVDGAVSKETFEEFGANTHDSSIFYDNVAKGEMNEEFEDWLFGATFEGEIGIIKTPYGWHIMYYCGESEDIVWRKIAREGAVAEDLYSWYQGINCTVTFDDSMWNKIFK